MGNRASAIRSEYNRKTPPEDDCCPICFGEFNLPCKTSCGHWYCASCMLELWMHSEDIPKPCKCPMCSSKITKLTPYSSQPVDLEVDVGEIIEELNSYNTQTIQPSFFQKAVRLTWLMLRCFRKDDTNMKTIFFYVLTGMYMLSAVLALLYVYYGCNFIPGGNLSIVVCPTILYGFMLTDAHLYKRRQRAGLFVEENADFLPNVKVLIKRMLLCFREDDMDMQSYMYQVLTPMHLVAGFVARAYDHYDLNFIAGGVVTIVALPGLYYFAYFVMLIDGIWYRRKQRVRRLAEAHLHLE